MPDYIKNAKNIIDISAFEKGKAECVLISPKDYAWLLEDIEDAHLLALANERM